MTQFVNCDDLREGDLILSSEHNMTIAVATLKTYALLRGLGLPAMITCVKLSDYSTLTNILTSSGSTHVVNLHKSITLEIIRRDQNT